MADSKTNRGKADRARVAAGEPYEVSYFAKKNKISKAKTLKLIKKYKVNRKKMEASLKKKTKKKKAKKKK